MGKEERKKRILGALDAGGTVTILEKNTAQPVVGGGLRKLGNTHGKTRKSRECESAKLKRNFEALMNSKKIITLIPLAQARKGERFIARILRACKRCPNYGFCAQRLRQGFTYEVKQVRDVKHYCPVAKTYMVVAEVAELPAKVALPKKYALVGAVMSLPTLQCNFKKCKYRNLCLPKGIKRGEKVKILKILPESLECPLNYELSLVLVQPLS